MSRTNPALLTGRGLPLAKAISAILGKGASVSFVFVGINEIRKLNRIYRHKDKPTDVLSFPLGKKGGEIFINPQTISKKSKGYGLAPRNYLDYIVIHALLHLKGYSHSSKMDKQEQRFCRILGIEYPFHKLKVNELQNNSRNRHRNISSKSSRSRKPRA